MKINFYSTGSPLIVPFYVPEKQVVMRNSTMRGPLYSAIYEWYNGRNRQYILSNIQYKMVLCEFFGTYLKMVLQRNSTMRGGVMRGLPVFHEDSLAIMMVRPRPTYIICNLIDQLISMPGRVSEFRFRARLCKE